MEWCGFLKSGCQWGVGEEGGGRWNSGEVWLGWFLWIGVGMPRVCGDELIPETGYVSVEFPTGDTYDGVIRDMVLDGVGCLVYRDGTQYKGDFRDGRKCGLGMTIFPNGDKHIGRYECNVFSGKGTYYNRQGGFKYVGNFKDGEFHGPAVVYYPGGVKFIGEYEMSKISKGEYVYPRNDSDSPWSSCMSSVSSVGSDSPRAPLSPRSDVEMSKCFAEDSSWIHGGSSIASESDSD